MNHLCWNEVLTLEWRINAERSSDAEWILYAESEFWRRMNLLCWIGDRTPNESFILNRRSDAEIGIGRRMDHVCWIEDLTQEITGVIRRTVHAKSHAGIAEDGSMRGARHPPNQEEELTNYRDFGLESGIRRSVRCTTTTECGVTVWKLYELHDCKRAYKLNWVY